MASNQAQTSQKRKWTAVIQGVCGLVAIACGIALIPLKADGIFIPYIVETFSRNVANAGFGIWGGVIVVASAIMGGIYMKKKAMISIYAAFSLVSTIVAVILFSVAVTGLARFTSLDASCQDVGYDYRYEYEYDNYRREYRCCFDHYDCYDRYNGYNYYQTTARLADPLKDYDSVECRNVRDLGQKLLEEKRKLCREEIRKTRPANLSVFAILLLVSVIGFIASITAAVLSFIVVCRGCCTPTQQQVVYLAYPANGQPGSVPMMVAASMAPRSPQMTGGAPNTMASSYPPQMAVVNPNVAPGLYPYPMPAVNQGLDPGYQVMTSMPTGNYNAMAAGADQWQADPPPKYEPAAANI